MASQISALPTPPSRSNPATFSALADAFLGALPTFRTEANALATEAETNAATAETQAGIALAQATIAVESADASLAAANYKGEWTALSGAATVPYCVSHNGKYWQLSSNLADVTSKTPGTDAVWLEVYPDHSCINASEKIQYPIPTSGYMMKAAPDGSPATATNTDAEVASAVSLKHTQHTDTGTTATSFKINTGGSEADIQTTGLTADRDYTLPDIDTMIAGCVLTAQNGVEIIAYS